MRCSTSHCSRSHRTRASTIAMPGCHGCRKTLRGAETDANCNSSVTIVRTHTQGTLSGDCTINSQRQKGRKPQESRSELHLAIYYRQAANKRYRHVRRKCESKEGWGREMCVERATLWMKAGHILKTSRLSRGLATLVGVVHFCIRRDEWPGCRRSLWRGAGAPRLEWHCQSSRRIPFGDRGSCMR